MQKKFIEIPSNEVYISIMIKNSKMSNSKLLPNLLSLKFF